MLGNEYYEQHKNSSNSCCLNSSISSRRNIRGNDNSTFSICIEERRTRWLQEEKYLQERRRKYLQERKAC